jgi:hypothetical protein
MSNRVDVMNGVYNRILEKKLIDETKAREVALNEVTSVRRMIKEFKKGEDESIKKI